ncbi:MAG: hypothetical protein AAB267_09685, partial [Candidatus Desantisbacteria bacterium]
MQPKITLIWPQLGVVGRLVTVHGSGYPDESSGPIYIFFGTYQWSLAGGTGYVNTNGTFSITFTINTQPYGTTTVTAQINNSFSNPVVWAVSTFIIKANITVVYPATDTVGKIVTVEGTGYRGNLGETVRIDFGTHNTITTIISTINGTFSITFRVSTQPGETKVITAFGTTSQEKATSTFWIKSQIILVSPQTQIVQGAITVQGTGYRNNETVQIDFGTHYTITTTKVLGNGTFSVTFLVSTQPYDPPIYKTITATGLGSKEVAIDTTTFTIKPNIFCIDPTQGSPGKIVTVWGTGYEETENIHILFGTDTDAQFNASTNINGTFSTTFTVTAQENGTTVITAQGVDSGVKATTTFIIIAGISEILPGRGPVGTVVTLAGGGYADNLAVQIDFGTHQTITTIITKENGTFSGTFIVSTQIQGTTVVTVMNIDGSGAKATTLFEILSQIILITPKIDFVN